MTPRKLNAVCCEFAGLEPTTVSIHSKGGDLVYLGPIEMAAPDWYRERGYIVTIPYSPVSTDWAAVGRLMEALLAKGVRFAVQAIGVKEVGVRIINSNFNWHWGPDLPMALALAVAELAQSHSGGSGQ